MTKDKKVKVEFAPGCFDNFEGSQEELDQLTAEIQNMFAGKTSEEIQAMSRPVDFENPSEEDIEIVEHLLNTSENKGPLH
jgi:hypothetical protein